MRHQGPVQPMQWMSGTSELGTFERTMMRNARQGPRSDGGTEGQQHSRLVFAAGQQRCSRAAGLPNRETGQQSTSSSGQRFSSAAGQQLSGAAGQQGGRQVCSRARRQQCSRVAMQQGRSRHPRRQRLPLPTQRAAKARPQRRCQTGWWSQRRKRSAGTPRRASGRACRRWRRPARRNL